MLVLPVATMKITERTLRISAASLIALLMVSAAYFLSGPSFLNRNTAEAGSTEELLKAYASKDTDSDGLPDWQEALYGTDPNKAVSNPFGIPDGEAATQGKLTPNSLASQLPSDTSASTTVEDILAEIPGKDPAAGSITEQFSQEFLQQVVNANSGQPLTDDGKQEFAQKLFTQYAGKAANLFASKYTSVSVHTDTTVSVNAYAGAVEQAFLSHDVAADGSEPLTLMGELVQDNDESARPKLVKLAGSYAGIRDDLLAMHVPPQLSDEHVALIRSFDTLSRATSAVSRFEEDPLAVMGALSVYQPASNQVLDSIKGIANVLISRGEPAQGEPGAMLVSIARAVETL